MLATHRDAENRYSEIRRITLEVAQSKLNQRPEYANIILKLFNEKAISAFLLWVKAKDRRVDWDWSNGYSDFKFRYPKRFELAIWYKNSLASLALGRPTYAGTALRLDFIEANPENTEDIKVFPITLFAMMTYAEALGATTLRVMKPINNEIKKYYESVGLVYVPNGDYLYMRL